MDQLLRVNIKTIEELHGGSILQDPRDLRPGRNELEHVTIILDGPRAMLGSMAHLKRVLEHGDQLLDLAVVQGMPRDAAPGGQPLEKVDPFIPFSVRGDLHGPLVLLQRDRESVSGKKVKATLRQALVDLVQDPVLLCGVQVSRELGQLVLPGWEVARCGWIQNLMRAIKLVPV